MAKKKKEDSEKSAEAKPEKSLGSDIKALMKDGNTEHQARQIVSLQSR